MAFPVHLTMGVVCTVDMFMKVGRGFVDRMMAMHGQVMAGLTAEKVLSVFVSVALLFLNW